MKKLINFLCLSTKLWNIKAVIIAIILVSPTSLFAQKSLITIHLTDTTVEAVLNEIRNQSDINLVYNHEQIKACPSVSINLKGVTVEQALKECLKTTKLEFQKINNIIVIAPKKESSSVPVEVPEVSTQTIRGRVLDRESGISLPFANVIVMHTSPQIGATTDEEGYFKIPDLPVGRYSIRVSYVGYEEAIIPEILLGSAKEVVLTVEISEKTQDLDEAVVSYKKGEPLNDMASVSAKSFSVEETKRYAASIGDPARMALTFAGVSTNDDASNEIVIRGNSPNWMVWRLEGVEIPSPNHFAEEGYSSGAVSILSTNMLGKSDFYTGAFPADYGNALSGVFDLRLRNGNNEKAEYSAQVGVLGVELSAEGPFKKGYRGSYLLNYRYSTLAILNHINFEVSENTLPTYQDMSFKFNLPTKKAGIFSIWGIGGESVSDEVFIPDTLLDEELEWGYSDYTKTGMYATGIGHTIFPDNKSYLKTVISNSQSYSSQTYDVMNSEGIMHGDFYDNLKRDAYRFSSVYNRKISNQFTIRSGITASRLDYRYVTREIDSLMVWNTSINSTGNTNLYQAFLQSKYKLSDNIVLTTGMHFTQFALNNDYSIEPRVGMEFNLKNDQKISVGYGQHSRNENLPLYFVEFADENGDISYLNKDLKLTHSTHYIASYEKMLSNDLNLKTEVYYQHITNLPISIDPDAPFSPAFNGVMLDTLSSAGKAKNYGIEFTLQKYFTNNYYFLITSSLFESKYRAIDKTWYNSRYNINYVNNFVGGKEIEWGSNKLVGLNAKLLWSGGKRSIPIDLESSIEEGEAVYNFDEIFTTKLSDYFRLDIGINIHFFKPKTEHIISLDIQNVTNRLNTWFEDYDSKKEEIIKYPMAGIIPILNYRIEF